MTLGAGLDLRVVAEGVATQRVKEALQRLGHWAMPGYLFSRPVGAKELTAQLQLQQPQAEPISSVA